MVRWNVSIGLVVYHRQILQVLLVVDMTNVQIAIYGLLLLVAARQISVVIHRAISKDNYFKQILIQ